ncbi:MAG: hypothetical protein IRZ16_03200 [Myxococcaceae bacterium]|nr:hypothetical protein [Myxococcaceae bacterium]
MTKAPSARLLRMLGCAALVAAASGVGCTHVRARPEVLVARLQDVPGGYVTGEVVGLSRRVQLDNKDFIYTIALTPNPNEAAYTRLAGKTINLAMWSLAEPARLISDVPLNDYQFDVESVDYSPDGKRVVTAGRDGVLRFFEAETGKAELVTYAEEPLVAAVFTPDGKHVVAGSAHGLLSVFRASDGAFESELRAHRGEVRAVAVTDDGRIFTGGWDKTIAVFTLEMAPVAVDEIHLSISQTPTKVAVVRAALGGHMGVFAFDAAQPWVVVGPKLAHAAGIQEALLSETTRVKGNEAKVAHGQTITLKQLTLENIDVAVCDNCLVEGTDGILGAPVLNRFTLDDNPITHELVLIAKEKHDPATLPQTPTLKEQKRFTFDAYVNDFSVDRRGERLGVALSHDKAERNREVYQREKNKVSPPWYAEDTAALVDAETGAILQRWHPHTTIVSSVGISPDGKTLVSGGWDNAVFVLREGEPEPRDREDFGWIIRRVRFSRDGRLVGVAAWTPQNAIGDQQSDPSSVIYDATYEAFTVAPRTMVGER